MAEGERASRLGLPGVPREAEIVVLDRDLRLIALTGARYHAALVSNSLSIEAMRRAKGAGLAVTCGVSINHLTLNEIDVGDYRTFLKLAPPLARGRRASRPRRRARRGDHRRHRLRSRSAGCRDEAAAVRRGGGGRDRPRDDALGGPAPRLVGRDRPAATATRDVDASRPKSSGCRAGGLRSARRPISSASILTSLMCSIPRRCIRAAAIRPSMRRGWRGA